jgi:antitoxin MazE
MATGNVTIITRAVLLTFSACSPLTAPPMLLRCLQMKTVVLKVSRIGNSRGIRLPAALLRKYHIRDTIVAEEKSDEIVLRPGRATRPKLSWEETAKAMAASKENWSEWDSTAADGLDRL